VAEPETAALSLTDLTTARGRAVATIERRLSAIAQWHKLKGHVTPTRDERVRLVLAMVAGLPLSAADLPTLYM
jgi:hypothetical protein